MSISPLGDRNAENDPLETPCCSCTRDVLATCDERFGCCKIYAQKFEELYQKKRSFVND